MESDMRKLKSLCMLTLPKINELLIKYQNDLKAFGLFMNLQLPSDVLFAVSDKAPQLSYEINEAVNDKDIFLYNYLEVERTINAFSPEDCSQIGIPEKMETYAQHIFTPELEACMQKQSTDKFHNNVYDNVNECRSPNFFGDHSSCVAGDSSNIYKAIPEVIFFEEGSNIISNSFNPTESLVEFYSQEDEWCSEKNNSMRKMNKTKLNHSEMLDEFLSLPLTLKNEKNFIPVADTSNSYLNVTYGNNRSADSFDKESIRNELEIFSQVFNENEDFIETIELNKSNIESSKRYISPIINIIEGPNNRTSSLSENDMADSNDIISNVNSYVDCDKTLSIEGSCRACSGNNQSPSMLKLQNMTFTMTQQIFLSENEDSQHKQSLKSVQSEQNCLINEFNNSSKGKSEDFVDVHSDLDTTINNKDGSFIQLEKVNGCGMKTYYTTNDRKEVTNENNLSLDKDQMINLQDKSGTTTNENLSCDIQQNHTRISNILKCRQLHEFSTNQLQDSNSCETKIISSNTDKENLISITNASDLRDLDISQTSSTMMENSKKMSTLPTSLSSASKKRHLDGSTTESTNIVNDEKEVAQLQESFISVRDDSFHNFKRKRKTYRKCTFFTRTRPIQMKKKSSNNRQINLTDISATSKSSDIDCTTINSGTVPEVNSKIVTSIKSSSALMKRNVSLDEVFPDEPTTDKLLKRDVITAKQFPSRTKVGTEEAVSKRKKKQIFKRFRPLRKLSAKEIRDDFSKQDNIMLKNSSDITRYYEQLIKRPSVRQIQNSKYLAFLIKTNDGVQIVPNESKAKTEKASSLFKQHHSNDSIDMSIFCDKNSIPFDQYLNSTEKNYKNFSKSLETEVPALDGNTTYNIGTRQSTGQSILIETSSFDKRQLKDTYRTQRCSFNKISRIEEKLTPDGYYKRNKDEITNVMNKYLQSIQVSTDQCSNIFQNDFVSKEDLTF